MFIVSTSGDRGPWVRGDSVEDGDPYHSEQKAIPRATACNPRDQLIYSLALGTGLRLAEIVGLDVGDVYSPDRRPPNPPRDHLYPFHALRHTAVTNVYRASRDLFLAQRFARHVSPLTTIYTHPSDQRMWERVRTSRC